MKKRILSIMLILALVASYLPMTATVAQAAETSNANYGQFRVKLTADPTTQIPIGGSDGFGTAASAGRIWTDKSVAANNDGSFGVTMSALAQEYTGASPGNPGLGGGGSANAQAADVTFILDMSTSMNAQDIGSYRRIQAMAMAANDAIKIVMDANPKNRVAVHWFGNYVTNEHVGTFMEMGSYTLPSGSQYLVYSNAGSTYTISTNTELIKDNAQSSYPTVSKSLAAGTPTQDGIMYGVSKAIAGIGGSRPESEPKRKPYVFILSDGAAIQGHKDWYVAPNNPTVPSSYTRSGNNSNNLPNLNPSDSASTNTGSADIAAVTILTGMYMKNQLEAAYRVYNADLTTESKFYTVGLGSNTAINGPYNSNQGVYAWAGLDPATVYSNESNDSFRLGTAKNTYNKIHEYTSGAYSAYSAYESNYIYSDYYKWAPDYTLLSDAFAELSSDVEAATAILPLLNIPENTAIGNSETADMASAIVLVDEIGTGFAVDPSTLKIGNDTAKVDTSLIIDGGTAYKFDSYASKAVQKTVDGVNTLTWYINAEDMNPHIYRFKNRTSPVAGQYTAPAGPFKLDYKVAPIFTETSDAVTTTNYYLNSGSIADGAKTAAYFTPPDDSPYYLSLTSPKTVSKTGGIGASYVSEESLSEDNRLTMKLGNNGRLDLEMGVIKSGPASVTINGNVTYTVIVYNYSDEDKTGLTVTSEGESQTNVNVPALGSKELTFTKTAPGTPQTVTSDEAQISGIGLRSNTVETIVTNALSVIYNGNGNEDGSPPVDSSTYAAGNLVTVLGNTGNMVKSGYSFAGWNTETGGGGTSYAPDDTFIMGSENVTLYAKWTPESYTVTFDSKGGSEVGPISGMSYNTTVTLPTAPEKAGYIFGGWFTDDEVFTSSFTGSTVVTGNITVYAKWTPESEPETYTVTFDSKGGSEVDPITDVSYNATVTLPTAPEKDGYIFGGWYTDDEVFTSSFTGSTPVTGNITVYARWTQNLCTVTFDKNGGDEEAEPGEMTIGEGNSLGTLPVPPKKNGYYFGGWNLADDGSGDVFLATTPVTVSMTVYAQWSLKPIPVITLTSDPEKIVGNGKSTSILKATVTTSTGEPLEGVKVIFSAEAGTLSTSDPVETNDRGEATVTLTAPLIENLTPLEALIEAVVNDTENDLEARQTLTVTFVPPAIEGQVIYKGEKIKDAKVSVNKDFGEGHIFSAQTKTNKDGKYTIYVPREGLYEVVISIPIEIGDYKGEVEFSQKADVSESSAQGETYQSEKKIVGQVFMTDAKRGQGDRPVKRVFDLLNPEGKARIVPVVTGEDVAGVEIKVFDDGRYEVAGVKSEVEYRIKFNLEYEGRTLVGPEIKVMLDADGQLVVEPVLIDPYGVIANSVTKNPIEGATVTLYWYDTQEKVELPPLDGFPPNANANHQKTNVSGEYAWMVFDHSDYYIIAEKTGYQTFDSRKDPRNEIIGDSEIRDGKIRVGTTIVKYDIEMVPLSTGGGGGGSPVLPAPEIVKHSLYIVGYKDGQFKPERPITRAELAAMLARLISEPVGKLSSKPFPDVPTNHWAASHIDLIKRKGIMLGASDGNFYPDAFITRGELAAVIVNFKDLTSPKNPTKAFKDTKGHWAEGMAEAVNSSSIMIGYPDGTFKINNHVSRVEAVIILNTLFNRGPLYGDFKAQWPDVTSSYWGYRQIEEASRSHEAHINPDKKGETWVKDLQENTW